jgi:hypothetical protein
MTYYSHTAVYFNRKRNVQIYSNCPPYSINFYTRSKARAAVTAVQNGSELVSQHQLQQEKSNRFLSVPRYHQPVDWLPTSILIPPHTHARTSQLTAQSALRRKEKCAGLFLWYGKVRLTLNGSGLDPYRQCTTRYGGSLAFVHVVVCHILRPEHGGSEKPHTNCQVGIIFASETLSTVNTTSLYLSYENRSYRHC